MRLAWDQPPRTSLVLTGNSIPGPRKYGLTSVQLDRLTFNTDDLLHGEPRFSAEVIVIAEVIDRSKTFSVRSEFSSANLIRAFARLYIWESVRELRGCSLFQFLVVFLFFNSAPILTARSSTGCESGTPASILPPRSPGRGAEIAGSLGSVSSGRKPAPRCACVLHNTLDPPAS